jgi:hypothetical protein
MVELPVDARRHQAADSAGAEEFGILSGSSNQGLLSASLLSAFGGLLSDPYDAEQARGRDHIPSVSQLQDRARELAAVDEVVRETATAAEDLGGLLHGECRWKVMECEGSGQSLRRWM